MNSISAINDDQLSQLLQLYYDEPLIFCKQILNVDLDEQQAPVILAMYNDPLNRYVSVRSGRGCGKTYAVASSAWHFLCTRSNSKVYITAPSGGTLDAAIWPTMAEIYDNMNPLYKDQFEFQTAQIKHKENPFTWFCVTRTARLENPDALAGTHSHNMLYIVDEASGVTDEMFRVIMGSLTQGKNNKLVMISNPRRLSGFFYESQNPSNKDTFVQLHMSALKSKWVSYKSIQDIKNMYGEDSNEYRVEVLGEFPFREDGAIIPWNLVNAAVERKDVEPVGEIRWGLDVGAGNDKSVLIKRQGPVVFNDIKKIKSKDTMKVVGEVVKEYNNTPDEFKPVSIYVDTIGVGKGPGDRLREQGLPIVPAVASNRAYRKKYNYNAKSEWWREMAEWFREQQPQLPPDKELIEELTTCRSVPSSDGRFKVEQKDKYKTRLKRSPDTADALAITFSMKSKKTVGLTTG